MSDSQPQLFNEKMFQKNRQALFHAHAGLAERLRDWRPPSAEYQPFINSKGYYALKCQGQAPIEFDSPSNPIHAAGRALQQLNGQPPGVLFIMGLGLGYSLEALDGFADKTITGLVIIEADINLFGYFLQRKDWSRYLTNPRVKFCVAESPGDIPAAIQALLPQIMGGGVQFYDHPPAFQKEPGYYQEVYDTLRRFMRQAAAESEFLACHGPLVQRNAIANILPITQSFGLGGLRNRLQNQPAVLVAAGPSLGKNLHHLASYQNRAHIFCVDTAYRLLLRQGIAPGWVAATDPTELNQNHFEELSPSPDTVLLFESDVFPSIPRHWPGPRVFINSEKSAVNRWLESALGPFGVFDQSLSVAQSLFTAASWMGCSPIILAGFDLAYPRQGGGTHAEGTALNRGIDKAESGAARLRVHQASFHPQATQEAITWVEGVDGRPVPTSTPLAVFLKSLSEAIRQSAQPVYDCTEGGAKIYGTFPGHLKETLAGLPNAPLSHPPQWLRGQALPGRVDPDVLITLQKELAEVIAASRAALQTVHSLMPWAGKTRDDNRVYQNEDWQAMETVFWQVYRRQATQIVLGQALFPAMFLFIRQEQDESEASRLKKYAKVFEAVIHWGNEFEWLLKAVCGQITAGKC